LTSVALSESTKNASNFSVAVMTTPVPESGHLFRNGTGQIFRNPQQRRAFVESYEACLARWQRGERDMLWPAGTWKMRVLHAVRCRPPP